MNCTVNYYLQCKINIFFGENPSYSISANSCFPWIVVTEKMSYVGVFARFATTIWSFLQSTYIPIQKWIVVATIILWNTVQYLFGPRQLAGSL